MSSSEAKQFFARVLLPLPLPHLYIYIIPPLLHEKIQIGMRVMVEFGVKSKKVYTGIVISIYQEELKNFKFKELLEILDTTPIVYQLQLDLWKWVADYYLCTMGEVMNVALPSGFKITSSSKIKLNPKFLEEEDKYSLTERECILVKALKCHITMNYLQVSKVLELKYVHPFIKSLNEREVIIIFQELEKKYKPQKFKKIRLNPSFLPKENLEALFEILKRKPKQLEVLSKYLSYISLTHQENEKGISKNILLKERSSISISSLRTMIKNNIIEEFEIIIPRFYGFETNKKKKIYLTATQKIAYHQIVKQFSKKNTVLLHDVVGNKKIELYIQLILKTIKTGLQALILLPEIILINQILTYFKDIFGNTLVIYHSQFSDSERIEIWKDIQNGKYTVIVGVHSAVFLPFKNLGLVIIDQEHDSSYKQSNHAPRYQICNLATMLAKLYNAKTILGSITPSIESYYLTQIGYYGLVTLPKQGDLYFPKVILSNTRRKKLKGKIKNEFSSVMISELKKTIKENKQAVLFYNRYGYAPYIVCKICNTVSECSNCHVKFTYHLYSNELRCHYCGSREEIPKFCKKCESTKLIAVGLGTEKLEDDLKLLLSQINIERIDSDTTIQKHSYQRIINDFKNRKINILIGTQMINKVLDHNNIGFVGIFDADNLIHFPNFRSHEHAFQLLTQITIKVGGKENFRKVIIQTRNPKQKLMRFITENNYLGFYEEEINERKQYAYPPFTRLIRITIKSDKWLRDRIGNILIEMLKKNLPKDKILGPQYPIIDKIRNEYLNEILIKLMRNKGNLSGKKKTIRKILSNLSSIKDYRKAKIIVDVDPI